MKVISERSICSNCQKCLFSMIQKGKFSATKIWHNIFSQFCWLNWNDKSIWLFFYKYVNFALFIYIIILNLHDWNLSQAVKESWVVFVSCKNCLKILDHSTTIDEFSTINMIKHLKSNACQKRKRLNSLSQLKISFNHVSSIW